MTHKGRLMSIQGRVEKETSRYKVLLGILLVLIVISSGFIVLEAAEKPTVRVAYTEKTLFLNNNTLINGNFEPTSSSTNENYQPDTLYLNPFNHELLVFLTKPQYEFITVNTTTDQTIGSLIPGIAGGAAAFDTSNNLTYLPVYYNRSRSAINGSLSYAIDGFDRFDKMVSSVRSECFVCLAYNPYNEEFYGALFGSNLSATMVPIVALNSSFGTERQLYISDYPTDILYNPFNHYTYVLNTFSASVTVIAPDNKILANLSIGSIDSNSLVVNPLNGSVLVAIGGNNYVSLISSSLQVTDYSFSTSLGPVASVAYDTALGVSLVGFHGLSVLPNGSLFPGKLTVMYTAGNILGSVPVGAYPTNILYDPSNRAIFVANYYPGTISVILLDLVKSSHRSVLVLLSLLLVILAAIAVMALNRWQGFFGKKARSEGS